MKCAQWSRVLILVLVAAAPVTAQVRDSSARDTTTSIRRYRLPPVIVTGSLSTFSSDKAGVARSVVSSEQLRAEPANAAVDPLRHVTGVYIDEAVGPLGPTIIRLRGGEETFTQVSMDGVPINDNGGFFDALGFSLVNVDRVEVARGPQSALYGSSAVSGVVQMFTRVGEYGPMRTEAMMEGGTAGDFGHSLRASVEASGGSERARFAFGVGSAYDRGIYRLPSDVRANEASLRFDFLTSGAFALTTVARLSGVDANQPVRDPGATRAPLDPNQRQGRDRVLASLAGTWMLGDRWTHQATVSHFGRDFLYEDARDSLDQSQFGSVFNFNLHYTSTLERTIARYVGTVQGEPGEGVGVSFSYGGEWSREALTDALSGDFGPSGSSLKRLSLATFAEAQARVGHLSVLAGSRVEKFGSLALAVVPRGTLVLDVVPQRVSLRVAVAHAYKAPNIQDQFNPFLVTNPDLKPESSNSWELGADVTSAKWKTTGSVTWFHQEYNNLIRSVNYDTTATSKQVNRNLGASRAAGLEAEIVIRPRPRWVIGASSAWTKTTIVDSGFLSASQFPKGEALPFRPTHTASAFIGLPATRTISVLARVTAIGRQTVLSDRFSGTRETVAPYHVLAATATWNVSPSADAYLQVENALNEVYQTAFDRNGSPRTAAVGMRLRR